MRKNYSMIAVLFGAALFTTSCASTETNSSEKEALNKEKIEVEIVDDSLVNVGNNYRFMKAVNKAKNGEQVTIAYLGGSITEGAVASPQKTNCYAYLSYTNFVEKFAANKDNVKYVNAGISGTPSMLGIERLNNDILSYSPDIVFVEFAVNDDGRIDDLKDTYESVVRKLLNSKSEPAVILVFTVGHTGGFWSAQDTQQQIGSHYNLGMISVRDAIQERISSGELSNSAYFHTDGIHPTNSGHKLIASFIENYFEKASAKEADKSYTVPADVKFAASYENIKNVELDETVVKNIGSFTKATLPVWNYKNYWSHSSSEGNSPLTMKLNCSKIIIAFQQKNNASYGNADVYVDGKKVSTVQGFSSSAWNNCATIIAYKSDTAALHTVEIKMSEGDEKKTINILGIGYTE